MPSRAVGLGSGLKTPVGKRARTRVARPTAAEAVRAIGAALQVIAAEPPAAVAAGSRVGGEARMAAIVIVGIAFGFALGFFVATCVAEYKRVASALPGTVRKLR